MDLTHLLAPHLALLALKDSCSIILRGTGALYDRQLCVLLLRWKMKHAGPLTQLKYMMLHCPALLKLLRPPAHLFDYPAAGEIKTEVYDMRPALVQGVALLQGYYSTTRIGVLEVCPGSCRAAAVCPDMPCFAHRATGFGPKGIHSENQ